MDLSTLWGQDGKANLCFVLKCQSRPTVIPRPFLLIEVAANHTHLSAKYISTLIQLTPLNPSLSMLNRHITAFISADSLGETAGAIFPPCSKLTHAHPIYR